jgi:hypothetical protein
MSGSRPTLSNTLTLTPLVIDPDEQTPVKNEIKMKVPEPFDGTRAKLLEFLGQVELYMHFNGYKFKNETEQVLFIVTLLKGAAYNWISPFLLDFTATKTSNGLVSNRAKRETQRYFLTTQGFGEGIRQVFGDIEQERTAERGL